MTPDPPVVPSWQSQEWARHLAQSVQHFCATCESYLVPHEGAICPCCSGSARFEDVR